MLFLFTIIVYGYWWGWAPFHVFIHYLDFLFCGVLYRSCIGLSIFQILVLCLLCILQFFLPFSGLSFLFLDIFWSAEVLYLNMVMFPCDIFLQRESVFASTFWRHFESGNTKFKAWASLDGLPNADHGCKSILFHLYPSVGVP